jgi:hypothetical protein
VLSKSCSSEWVFSPRVGPCVCVFWAINLFHIPSSQYSLRLDCQCVCLSYHYFENAIRANSYSNFKGIIPFPNLLSFHYSSAFSFWDGHLLSRQDLDVISIPFQIYIFKASTTRFLTREATIVQKHFGWLRHNQGSVAKINVLPVDFVKYISVGTSQLDIRKRS